MLLKKNGIYCLLVTTVPLLSIIASEPVAATFARASRAFHVVVDVRVDDGSSAKPLQLRVPQRAKVLNHVPQRAKVLKHEPQREGGAACESTSPSVQVHPK
jgi:hypothetical protein